jgi:hypothetical protein
MANLIAFLDFGISTESLAARRMECFDFNSRPGDDVYSFRIRFRLGARVRIDSPLLDLQIHVAPPVKVRMRARLDDVPLRDARDVLIVGSGYLTEADAADASTQWRERLQLAFARTDIGADFGDRAPGGGLTHAGLLMLAARSGARVLNDVHGVMIYESEPQPLFAGSSVSTTVGRSVTGLQNALAAAERLNATTSEQERLAFDLFSASFDETSADARLMMLMMAIETLIQPADRGAAANAHVDAMIQATRTSNLPSNEIASIVGSLQWLRTESISQAGRRLARALGDRTYLCLSPERFFTRCYDLRSRLAHGAVPRPSWTEVNEHAAALEIFVSHLLSGELLDAVDL